MSPQTVFPQGEDPQNAITERVLQHPRVTYDTSGGVLAVAIKDELLVRTTTADADNPVVQQLKDIATKVGAVPADDMHGSPFGIEVWQLNDPNANSIDEARHLRDFAAPLAIPTHQGQQVQVPSISPNHICTVSKYDMCPSSPPTSSTAPHNAAAFIPDAAGGLKSNVLVLDSGYISGNSALDGRVTSLLGVWLDPSVQDWRDCSADALDNDGDGKLDGPAGHGTFVAGLIAHVAGDAGVTVVGMRQDCLPLGAPADPNDAAMLFTTELAVARSMILRAEAQHDVIHCGFAFPTLDNLPSIAFSGAMAYFGGAAAPRQGVAVVAPAGNESSDQPYWPAAHPDVIGVAATNRRGLARADFSNWGDWLQCCCRGEGVVSTFIDWTGPVEGEDQSQTFAGWAHWDGTSFAAPKVAGAIAGLMAANPGAQLPVEAYHQIAGGKTGVTVSQLVDPTLTKGGVSLPQLHLG